MSDDDGRGRRVSRNSSYSGESGDFTEHEDQQLYEAILASLNDHAKNDHLYNKPVLDPAEEQRMIKEVMQMSKLQAERD
jgi:hypothetical protein